MWMPRQSGLERTLRGARANLSVAYGNRRPGRKRAESAHWRGRDSEGVMRGLAAAIEETVVLVFDLAGMRRERPLAVDIPGDLRFPRQLPDMDAHLRIERT